MSSEIARHLLWRCKDCGAVTLDGALLEAPSPFGVDQIILGCPKCKSAEGFDNACDEPGCDDNATCGFLPATGGYRRTCSKHYREANP